MKVINSFYLKIIALIFMTIDHIGAIYNLPIFYRIIGRVSFPLFAFILAQGYIYTKNKSKYFFRLFTFGVSLEILLMIISQFVYLEVDYRNIFLTLSFGLLTLWIFDSKYNLLFKTFLISYLIVLSVYLNFDYSWYGILFILSFKFYPKYFYFSIIIQIILAFIYNQIYMSNIQYFALLAWIFIIFYNHKKGYSFKYLFYLYYPFHLFVLYLVYYLFY